jgi:Bacterial Ig domain
MKKIALATILISAFLFSVLGALTIRSGTANPYGTIKYMDPPIITITSPLEDQTFSSNPVSLEFTITKREQTMWITNWTTAGGEVLKNRLSYVSIVIDGEDYRTVQADNDLSSPFSFQMNLTNLENGTHNLTIIAYCDGVEIETHGSWARHIPYNASSAPIIFNVNTSEQFDYSQFEGLPYDPPIVTVASPSPNATYIAPDVPINVAVQIRGWIYGNIEQIRLLNYSLDGHPPSPLTLTVPSMYGIHVPYDVYGNLLLTGLADGNHNLTVHGETFIGALTCYFNETVSFRVDTSFTPRTEPFPALLVFVASVGLTLVALGLVAYFKRFYRDKGS